jgi:hypothetical protein
MPFPSTFPRGTLGFMMDKISDQIARTDLGPQIAEVINDAILFYQPHRFIFSEGRDTSLSTVVGQEFYGVADDVLLGPAGLFSFDYITVTIGTAQFDLPRYQPEAIELLSQSGTQMGQPQCYSYYNYQMRLYPVPNAVYPLTIAAHQRIAAPPDNTTTGNPWMVDGERLIRGRAKYEIALNYTSDLDEAQRMTAYVTEAFDELVARSTNLGGTGYCTPTQF